MIPTLSLHYIKEISSQKAGVITYYDVMSNEDRELFFKGYEFNRTRDVYVLKHPEFIDKMYDKKGVMENENERE